MRLLCQCVCVCVSGCLCVCVRASVINKNGGNYRKLLPCTFLPLASSLCVRKFIMPWKCGCTFYLITKFMHAKWTHWNNQLPPCSVSAPPAGGESCSFCNHFKSHNKGEILITLLLGCPCPAETERENWENHCGCLFCCWHCHYPAILPCWNGTL